MSQASTGGRRRGVLGGTVIGFATVALVLAAPAAASASEWRIESQTLATLGVVQTTTRGSGGNLTLESEPFGKVECEGLETSGMIVRGGTGTETADLSGKCHVVGQAACVVAEPIPFDANTQLMVVGGTLYEDLVPKEAGGTFGSVVITGALCPLANTYALRGSLAAGVEPSGAELIVQPRSFSAAISMAAGTQLYAGKKRAVLSAAFSEVLKAPYEWRSWGVE